MKIGEFEEEAVLISARQHFPDQVPVYVKSDLYLHGVESGAYKSDLYDDTIYVSTEYGYHHVMVQGNLTSVKIGIACILLKDEEYQVIYDSKDRYYVAVAEKDGYQFIEYDAFLKQVVATLKKLTENGDE